MLETEAADLSDAILLLAELEIAEQDLTIDDEYDPELDADPTDGETALDYGDTDSDPNNLAGIAYALSAGMPATRWKAAKKNPKMAGLMAKARRQFEQASAAAFALYAAGRIDATELGDRLRAAFRKGAKNAYIAGKRAMGDYTSVSTDDEAAFQVIVGLDEGPLTAAASDSNGQHMGVVGLANKAYNDYSNVQMVRDTADKLLGRETEADAKSLARDIGLAGLAGAGLSSQLPPVEKVGLVNEQYEKWQQVQSLLGKSGSQIESYGSLGEMDALGNLPGETVLVYWQLGDADHCLDCIALSDASPLYLSALDEQGIFPGSGHTVCGWRCHCSLQYEVPDQVCGDGMSDVAVDPGDLIESAVNPGKFNIWVQEADSCSNPLDVSSFQPDGADPNAITDEDAFSWDEDIASQMEVEPLDDAQPFDQALAGIGDLKAMANRMASFFDWTTDVVPEEEHAAMRISKISNEVSDFHYVWHDTAEKIVFDAGEVTAGPPALQAEFTMKSLSELAARAKAEGKALVINGQAASPGMKSWLDLLGADKTVYGAHGPTIIPHFPSIYTPADPLAPIAGRVFADDKSAVKWGESVWKPDPNAEKGAINYGTVEAPNWKPAPTDYKALGLTQTQYETLDQYAGGHYSYINATLRGDPNAPQLAKDMAHAGHVPTAQDIEAEVHSLDTAVNKQVLPEAVVTTRGISPDAIGGMDPAEAVGKTFTDPGFMSTSIGVPNYDLNLGGKGKNLDLYLNLTVPAGTPAYLMRNVSAFKEENELLLGRGLSYHIDGIHTVPGGWPSKPVTKTILDAHIVADPIAADQSISIGISRMRPELGTPTTYNQLLASRANETIANAEATTTFDLENKVDVDVADQRQAIGVYEGKPEPTLQVHLNPNDSTLADIDIANAYLVRRNMQDSTNTAITGAAIKRLGLKPNGQLWRIDGLPVNKIDEVYAKVAALLPTATILDHEGAIEFNGFTAMLDDETKTKFAQVAQEYGAHLEIHPANIRWTFHDKAAQDAADWLSGPADSITNADDIIGKYGLDPRVSAIPANRSLSVLSSGGASDGVIGVADQHLGEAQSARLTQLFGPIPPLNVSLAVPVPLAVQNLSSVLTADYKAWAATLDPWETNAVKKYVSADLYGEGAGKVSALDINHYLRLGESDPAKAKTYETLKGQLDSAIDKGHLEGDTLVHGPGPHMDEPLTVWRGSALHIETPKIGDVIADPAYLSTSLDPSVAANFASVTKNGGFVYRIALPDGAHAAFVPALPKASTAFAREKEVLLPRGFQMQVVGLHENVEVTATSGVVAHVTVIDLVPKVETAPAALSATSSPLEKLKALFTPLDSIKAPSDHAIEQEAKVITKAVEAEKPLIPTGDLTTVKSLGGSTGAKLVKDPATGIQYVDKFGANAGHVTEEYAADRAYESMGYAVTQSALIQTANGPMKRAIYIDGQPLAGFWKTASAADKALVKERIQSGLAFDALMANWDVVGLEGDNILITKDLIPFRIDNGGSLRYRAQGALKGVSFGPDVSELTKLRDTSKGSWAGRIFGDTPDGELRRQIEVLDKNRPALLASLPIDVRSTIDARLDDMMTKTSSWVPAPAVDVLPKPLSLIGAITPEEAAAVDSWQGGNVLIKDFLRGNASDAQVAVFDAGAASLGKPTMADTIARLDSAIDKGSLADAQLAMNGRPFDMVYRGIETSGTIPAVGDVIVDKSYISTSISPKIAAEFATTGPGGTSVIYRMALPAGQKALWLGASGEHAAERELLLPRNLNLRVIDRHDNVDIGSWAPGAKATILDVAPEDVLQVAEPVEAPITVVTTFAPKLDEQPALRAEYDRLQAMVPTPINGVNVSDLASSSAQKAEPGHAGFITIGGKSPAFGIGKYPPEYGVDTTPAGMMRHEFGHVVLPSMQYRLSPDDYKAFQASYDRAKVKITSTYAKTGLLPSERAAETFTAAMGPIPPTDPDLLDFRKRILAAGPMPGFEIAKPESLTGVTLDGKTLIVPNAIVDQPVYASDFLKTLKPPYSNIPSPNDMILVVPKAKLGGLTAKALYESGGHEATLSDVLGTTVKIENAAKVAPETMATFASAAARVRNVLPGAFKMLHRIGFTDLQGAFGRSLLGDMMLDEKAFSTDLAKTLTTMRDQIKTGFLVDPAGYSADHLTKLVATDDQLIGYTLIHEYGHQVDDYFTNNPATSEDWKAFWKKNVDPISGYGAQSDKERHAEAFVGATFNNGSYLTGQLRQFIVDHGGQLPSDGVLPKVGSTTWLFKPKKIFQTNEALSRGAAEVESTADVIARQIGVNVKPVIPYTVAFPGKDGLAITGGNLQEIVKDVIPITDLGDTPAKVLDAMTPMQLTEMQQGQIFDWLVGNDDGHEGQWMIQKDGHILGIDKDAAVWELPGQYILGHNTMDDGLGFAKSIFTEAPSTARLAKLDTSAIAAVLDRTDAISDEQYVKMIRPIIPTLMAHPNAVKLSEDQWLAYVMQRKANLRHDVETYFVDHLAALPKDVTIPGNWKAFLDNGGHFPSKAAAADMSKPIVLKPVGEVKPYVKPEWTVGDPSLYDIPGSPIPLNAPLPGWSGFEPPTPPFLNAKPTGPAMAKIKADANDVFDKHSIADVIAGKINIAISQTPQESVDAEKAGLAAKKIGGVRFYAKSEADLVPIIDYLSVPGHTASDTEAMELLGFTKDDQVKLQQYGVAKAGLSARAGVVVVEPDGRMWVLAPNNQFGGYQNTWTKGGIDGDETAAKAAVREVREETGIGVELDGFLGDYVNKDQTSISRMFIGHRTGGGPLYAHPKETYKIKLMTPQEAAKALTQHNKPDPRDQAILADAVKAIKGTSGIADYTIPAEDVGSFKGKITSVLDIKVPDTTPAGPLDPGHFASLPIKYIDEPKAGTAFGFDAPAVNKMFGTETIMAATDGTTRSIWTLPDNTLVQTRWVSGRGVKWLPSQTYINDPAQRLNVHVAQLRAFAERYDADHTLIQPLRINNLVLADVPSLRDFVTANGALVGNLNTTIDRDHLVSMIPQLRGAAKERPLPFIPATPLTPRAKAMVAGVELDRVAQAINDSTTASVVIDTRPVFDQTVWAAKPMAQQKADWKALDQATRDQLSDPPKTVQSYIDEQMSMIEGRNTTITDPTLAIAERMVQATDAGVITSESSDKIAHQMTLLLDGLKGVKADARVTLDLVNRITDATIAQEMEATARSLGDHGINHIEGNTKMALEALKAIPGADTPQNRLFELIAAPLHDTGYLTPQGQLFITAEHAQWGAKYYSTWFQSDVEEVLGKDESIHLRDIIATHDTSTLDWVNDPQGSAFRLADNLALFHDEKLPAFVRDIPENRKLLIQWGNGDIGEQAAKDAMKANIAAHNELSEIVRAQLLDAVQEAVDSLPKLTVGMLGGKIGPITWVKDHVAVDLIRGESNEALAKVVDLGSEQFAKFAKSYNLDGEVFVKDGKFVLTDNGKIVLTADIKTPADVAPIPDQGLPVQPVDRALTADEARPPPGYYLETPDYTHTSMTDSTSLVFHPPGATQITTDWYPADNKWVIDEGAQNGKDAVAVVAATIAKMVPDSENAFTGIHTIRILSDHPEVLNWAKETFTPLGSGSYWVEITTDEARSFRDTVHLEMLGAGIEPTGLVKAAADDAIPDIVSTAASGGTITDVAKVVPTDVSSLDAGWGPSIYQGSWDGHFASSAGSGGVVFDDAGGNQLSWSKTSWLPWGVSSSAAVDKRAATLRGFGYMGDWLELHPNIGTLHIGQDVASTLNVATLDLLKSKYGVVEEASGVGLAMDRGNALALRDDLLKEFSWVAPAPDPVGGFLDELHLGAMPSIVQPVNAGQYVWLVGPTRIEYRSGVLTLHDLENATNEQRVQALVGARTLLKDGTIPSTSMIAISAMGPGYASALRSSGAKELAGLQVFNADDFGALVDVMPAGITEGALGFMAPVNSYAAEAVAGEITGKAVTAAGAWDAETEKAYTAYRSTYLGGGDTLAKALRDGLPLTPEQTVERDLLDAGTNKYVTDQPLTLFRGVSPNHVVTTVGSTFADKTYMYAAPGVIAPLAFTGSGKGYIYRMLLPEGSHFGVTRTENEYAEVLLPRGQMWKVEAVHPDFQIDALHPETHAPVTVIDIVPVDTPAVRVTTDLSHVAAAGPDTVDLTTNFVDTKVAAPPGIIGPALTHTTFATTKGASEWIDWRRYGNRFEVWGASGNTTIAAQQAHFLRLAEAVDKNPAIAYIRYVGVNPVSNDFLPAEFKQALVGAGGKLNAGGLKIDRTELLALRDKMTNVVTVAAAEPEKVNQAVKVLTEKYHLETAMVPIVDLTVTDPDKYHFVWHTYTVGKNESYEVVDRTSKTELWWRRTGAAKGSMIASSANQRRAQMNYLLDAGDRFKANPGWTRLRMTNLGQIDQSIRNMLLDHGATTIDGGKHLGETLVMERSKFMDLTDQLDAEMGKPLMAVKEVPNATNSLADLMGIEHGQYGIEPSLLAYSSGLGIDGEYANKLAYGGTGSAGYTWPTEKDPLNWKYTSYASSTMDTGPAAKNGMALAVLTRLTDNMAKNASIPALLIRQQALKDLPDLRDALIKAGAQTEGGNLRLDRDLAAKVNAAIKGNLPLPEVMPLPTTIASGKFTAQIGLDADKVNGIKSDLDLAGYSATSTNFSAQITIPGFPSGANSSMDFKKNPMGTMVTLVGGNYSSVRQPYTVIGGLSAASDLLHNAKFYPQLADGTFPHVIAIEPHLFQTGLNAEANEQITKLRDALVASGAKLGTPAGATHEMYIIQKGDLDAFLAHVWDDEAIEAPLMGTAGTAIPQDVFPDITSTAGIVSKNQASVYMGQGIVGMGAYGDTASYLAGLVQSATDSIGNSRVWSKLDYQSSVTAGEKEVIFMAEFRRVAKLAQDSGQDLRLSPSVAMGHDWLKQIGAEPLNTAGALQFKPAQLAVLNREMDTQFGDAVNGVVGDLAGQGKAIAAENHTFAAIASQTPKITNVGDDMTAQFVNGGSVKYITSGTSPILGVITEATNGLVATQEEVTDNVLHVARMYHNVGVNGGVVLAINGTAMSYASPGLRDLLKMVGGKEGTDGSFSLDQAANKKLDDWINALDVTAAPAPTYSHAGAIALSQNPWKSFLETEGGIAHETPGGAAAFGVGHGDSSILYPKKDLGIEYVLGGLIAARGAGFPRARVESDVLKAFPQLGDMLKAAGGIPAGNVVNPAWISLPDDVFDKLVAGLKDGTIAPGAIAGEISHDVAIDALSLNLDSVHAAVAPAGLTAEKYGKGTIFMTWEDHFVIGGPAPTLPSGFHYKGGDLVGSTDDHLATALAQINADHGLSSLLFYEPAYTNLLPPAFKQLLTDSGGVLLADGTIKMDTAAMEHAYQTIKTAAESTAGSITVLSGNIEAEAQSAAASALSGDLVTLTGAMSPEGYDAAVNGKVTSYWFHVNSEPFVYPYANVTGTPAENLAGAFANVVADTDLVSPTQYLPKYMDAFPQTFKAMLLASGGTVNADGAITLTAEARGKMKEAIEGLAAKAPAVATTGGSDLTNLWNTVTTGMESIGAGAPMYTDSWGHDILTEGWGIKGTLTAPALTAKYYGDTSNGFVYFEAKANGAPATVLAAALAQIHKAATSYADVAAAPFTYRQEYLDAVPGLKDTLMAHGGQAGFGQAGSVLITPKAFEEAVVAELAGANPASVAAAVHMQLGAKYGFDASKYANKEVEVKGKSKVMLSMYGTNGYVRIDVKALKAMEVWQNLQSGFYNTPDQDAVYRLFTKMVWRARSEGKALAFTDAALAQPQMAQIKNLVSQFYPKAKKLSSALGNGMVLSAQDVGKIDGLINREKLELIEAAVPKKDVSALSNLGGYGSGYKFKKGVADQLVADAKVTDLGDGKIDLSWTTTKTGAYSQTTQDYTYTQHWAVVDNPLMGKQLQLLSTDGYLTNTDYSVQTGLQSNVLMAGYRKATELHPDFDTVLIPKNYVGYASGFNELGAFYDADAGAYTLNKAQKDIWLKASTDDTGWTAGVAKPVTVNKVYTPPPAPTYAPPVMKAAPTMPVHSTPPTPVAAPAPIFVPPPPPPPVVAQGIAAKFAYDKATLDHLDAQGFTETVVSTGKYGPSKATVWSVNGTPVTVKWGYDDHKGVTLYHLRSVTGGTEADQKVALLAQIRTQLPGTLTADPKLTRVLIDHKALAPGLSDMLDSAGWKSTKAYYTSDKAGVNALADALKDDKAAWSDASTIPSAVAPGGSSPFMLPPAPKGTHAAPSFIYGFDKTKSDSIYTTMVDTDFGKQMTKGGEATAVHQTVFGSTVADWSVSPSGKNVGWTALSTSDPAEAQNAAFAMLRKMAEDGSTRDTGLFVQPNVYDSISGMRQMLLDAGGKEQDFPKLGTAIQLNQQSAKNLLDALSTDTMGNLKVSISAPSDYLVFDNLKATGMFDAVPSVGPGGAGWDLGQGHSGQAMFQTTNRQTSWTDIAAPTGQMPLTAVAQLQWFAQEGYDNVLVGEQVLAKVPKLAQFLIASGAKIEGSTIRLDSITMNHISAFLNKEALPEMLGGKKLPFSIIDSMGAKTSAAVEGALNEVTGLRGVFSGSEITIGQATIKSDWTKSASNLYWRGLDGGTASAGQLRSGTVSQLRSLLDQVGTNGSLERFDIDEAVLSASPNLQQIVDKYGAVRSRADDGTIYYSFDRARAARLLDDINKELGDVIEGVPGFAYQQALLVKWPKVDELTVSKTEAEAAKAFPGKAAKMTFTDSAGNEWMFKPGESGAGTATDAAAYQLSLRLGLPLPPVQTYTLNIAPLGDPPKFVSGSLQKIIPGMAGVDVATLNTIQTQDMLKASVLDWVMANDDAHAGNYLIAPDGHLWSMDKTSGYQSLKGAFDTLDRNNDGSGGQVPLIFKFFRDAVNDPTKLSLIHPQSIALTLRNLQNITDEEFTRLVSPIAYAATKNPLYAGKPEQFLADMLARKNSATTDFQSFFQRQIKDAMAVDPTRVPKEWSDWVAAGGEFNLDQTPRDLWMAKQAELDGIFGNAMTIDGMSYPAGYSPEKVKALLAQNVFAPIRSEVHTYYGGGASGHMQGKYGAELIRPRLAKKGLDPIVKQWEDVNQWGLLHILSGDKGPVSDSIDRRFRKQWDPDTGTLKFIRSTNRYKNAAGRADDPLAYVDGYNREGVRNLVGGSIDDHNVIAAGGGVYIYVNLPYDKAFTSYALGYGAGSSEIEVLAADIRPDQIFAIRPQSRPLDLNGLINYNGPLVA